MEDIKLEDECCCCFNKDNLYTMLEPYIFEDNVEIYSTMIAECFQIELSPHIDQCKRDLYLICNDCVLRLKDAIVLRSQVKTAYDRLQADGCKKNNIYDTSSVCIEDVKIEKDMLKNDTLDSEDYHIEEENSEEVPVECSEYDNKEVSMNVDSEYFLSSENLLRLKPLQVVLEKTNDHNLTRSIEKKHVCEICEKAFISASRLTMHKKLHSDQRNWNCKYCAKSFISKTAVRAHEKVHFSAKYICDYCRKEFKCRMNMVKHILQHMDIKNLKCDKCDKYFESKDCFDRHITSNNCEYPCNICGTTLKSYFKLKQHNLTQHKIRGKYCCDKCDWSFVRKFNLMRHMRTHMNKKSRVLPHSRITTTCNLTEKRRAGEISGKYCCDHCDWAFDRKYNLMRHIKTTHLNEKSCYVTCKYCPKQFKSKYGLREHEMIHLNVKYICDYCKMEFQRRTYFVTHIRTHADIKNIKCDRCEESFVSRLRLYRHKKTHHSVSCNICGEAFASNYELKQHNSTHSTKKKRAGEISGKYCCDYCDWTFDRKYNLMRHIKTTHLNVKNSYLTCKYCSKRFKSKYALKEHEMIHLNVKYICDYCRMEFQNRVRLVQHILKHMDVKNLKCDKCGNYFVSKVRLNSHIKSCRSEYLCNICGKTFRSYIQFKQHNLTHSTEKKHVCEVCGKAFITTNRLTIHKKLHSDQRNWNCKYCTKAFIFKTALRDHEKIHFSSKLFCDFCKKAFKNKTTFDIHVLRHRGVINVKCDECNEGFASKNCLWRHKKKYHSARPLCTVCGQSFKDLEKHMLVHSEVRQFICDKCGKTFKRRNGIYMHVKYCYFGIKYKVYYRVTPYIRPSKRNLVISRK